MECDVLVIGHGAAGCLASAVLAGKGMDVTMVGRGTTATELSTGRIVLPEDHGDLAALLLRIGRDQGMYLSAPGRKEAITNMGTIQVQDLTSEHDWLPEAGGCWAVMGLRGNDDLDPDLACRILSRRQPHLECDPLWSDPGIPATVDGGRGRSLSEEARGAVDRLSGILSELKQEAVVLPPLFAGPHYADALVRLEQACGRTVREPATPLSNPGRRLQACLESHAIGSGCRFLRGREVRRLLFDGARASSAVVSSGLREQEMRFRAVVMATGSLIGGGLAVNGEAVSDPLGIFAVGGPRGAMAGTPLLSGALSSGIMHHDGRALLYDGTVATNVMVAGSSVPGLSFPLGRGLGDVMASALEAAERAMEVL